MPRWSGVWRISKVNLQAFLDAAYQETAERIAAGDVGEVPGADRESSPRATAPVPGKAISRTDRLTP